VGGGLAVRSRRQGGAESPDEQRLQRLERLARLREQGVLNDEELAAEKTRVLGSSPR
jgi:hypothetical protein